MKRRKFLVAAAGATALTAGWMLRPEDRGAGGHGDYFSGLSAALHRHGLARPTMILDLDILEGNIREVTSRVQPRDLRIVAKSLPSIPLLSHVMKAASAEKLMVFHEPFLALAAQTQPNVHLLVGKPFPVAAASRYYKRPMIDGFDASRQVQWLIDTPGRLRQYGELASAQRLEICVNIEIDVGLHRGGVASTVELASMLDSIAAHSHLHFGGLMGYDPHVAKIPTALGLQRREFKHVQARYAEMLKTVREHRSSTERVQPLVFNAAGSPTYRLWDEVDGIANELAVGSGLVKPLDFDIPTLEAHRPALFIATPVLKAQDGLSFPGIQQVGDLQRIWNPNRARTFFLYGGYWKARPVSPHGLSENPLFGRSTNQEMLTGSKRVELDVDDYVFFRPTQSEFVMLQFGDIAVMRAGEIVDFWPTFAEPALSLES